MLPDRYSYEQIFKEYGQYDSFVHLTFYQNSKAYNSFGETLSGTFLYDKDKRIELQRNIEIEPISQTGGYIQFIPSTLLGISSENREHLDRIGILSSDIELISSFNFRPRENRFVLSGQKELQNVIILDVPESENPELEIDRIKIGIYSDKLKNEDNLLPEEMCELIGLLQFHNNKRISPEVKDELTDENTGKLIPAIRYYELKAKLIHSTITKEEELEFNQLEGRRINKKMKLVEKELQKSSEKLKEIAKTYKTNFYSLLYLCMTFDAGDMRLSHKKYPVWWDFERFLHISIRHVKEVKVGERFDEKSVFQYKFKDVKRIIEAVIEKVYGDYILYLGKNPDKVFIRRGGRSAYYDGVYYRIEIEPSGKLRAFHPYQTEKLRDGV